MKADIFIPISRNTQHLEKCIESISKQSNQQFCIIAVALSDDVKIKQLLQKYIKEFVFVVQDKPGLLHAANLALNHAKHDVFIRIDDDIVASKDWLASVMKTFEDTKVGGVTGPTIIKRGLQEGRDLFAYLNDFKNSKNPFKQLLSFLYEHIIYEGKMKEVSLFTRSGAFTLGSNFEETVSTMKDLKAVDNLEACNFAVRRVLLEQFGGFDPVFELGLSEYHEADIACKIKEAGYMNIFNPKAKIWHNVQRTTHVRGDSYHRIRNFIIFYKRHLAKPDLISRMYFLIHVMMQNGYYMLLFLKTGNIRLLGAIPGSVVGLFRPV